MQRLLNGLILSFVFSIPLLPAHSIKLLVLALIGLIIIQYKKFSLQRFFVRSWDILLYLSILALGLIWSEDILAGTKALETSLSLVGIAIVASFWDNLVETGFNKILWSFTYGVLLASLVCVLFALFNYLKSADGQVFFYYNLVSIIKSHPTYLAYYIILSISWLLYQLYSTLYSITRLLFHLACLFFLSVVLVLSGGQTAFISLVFIFSFFLLKYFTEAKTNRSTLVIYSICVLTGLLVMVKLNLILGKNVLQDDSWERYHLWQAGIMANTDFFWGVGTGDVKAILNSYLHSVRLNDFAAKEYNSHNQFIQMFLSSGIIGLCILVIMIGRPLYTAYKARNVFGVLLLFPFIIYGVTEVFLGRYQGVVFFALTHQLLITQCYLKLEATSLLRTRNNAVTNSLV